MQTPTARQILLDAIQEQAERARADRQRIAENQRIADEIDRDPEDDPPAVRREPQTEPVDWPGVMLAAGFILLAIASYICIWM